MRGRKAKRFKVCALQVPDVRVLRRIVVLRLLIRSTAAAHRGMERVVVGIAAVMVVGIAVRIILSVRVQAGVRMRA